MSVVYVAAGAVVLTSGLIIASAILAAEGTSPVPTAQMNRSTYVERSVPTPVAQMNRSSYSKRSEPAPVAQMNRALYDHIKIRAKPRVLPDVEQ